MKKHLPNLKQKISILLLLCVFIFIADVKAEGDFSKQRAETLFTLEMKAVNLTTAIKALSREANKHFVYNESDLNNYPKIDLVITRQTFEEALQSILENTQVSYVIENNVVILKKDDFKPARVAKQELITITGYINDNFGNPLPGVSVSETNSTNTTVSNEKGYYIITANDNTVLKFSMMGMQAHTYAVRAKGSKGLLHSFTMQESTQEIDNVVVTGYQTFNRRDVAGAISSVKMKDLTQLGAVSVDQMLQGKIAGMAVTGVVGNPGASPKIRIRGTSSITGDQEPIWVVDGVIWDEPVPIRNRDLASADDLTLFNMVGGSIAGLNPNDIESIDVLKDASATAIYGVKAVNGVIVVTTKKGKSGVARINYSANVQTKEKPSYGDFNLMNAAERLKTAEEIYRTGGLLASFPGPNSYEGLLVQFLRKDISQGEFDQRVQELANTNTDWFDVLFQNSISQNHSLSMSGGNDKTSYYFSGGYYDEQSNAKGSGLKRYNGNIRLVNKFSDKFEADIKIGIGARDNIGFHPSLNPYNYAINTSRAIPLHQADGSRLFYEMGTPRMIGAINYFHTFNVLNELEQTRSQSSAKEINSVLNMQWKIMPWLTWNGLVSYNNTQTIAEEWATEESYNVSDGTDAYGNKQRGYPYGMYEMGSTNYNRSKLPTGGTLLNDNLSSSNYTIRNQFIGAKTFNDVHRVQVILGQETRSLGYKGMKELLYGFYPDRGKMIIPPTTLGYKDFLSSFKPVRFTDKASNYFSLFSIANYTYNDKYIVNASVRYDGSNVFGKDATYRFLPVWSAAGKWIVSNESFIQDVEAISFMALRASYGVQGNIRSDASPSLVIRLNDMDGETGKYKASIASLPNPNLRWEKTHSYNIGYELSLWNALNISLDYYYKKGSDLIIDKAVSTISGRNNILLNAGNMENKGVELTLSAYPIKRNDFSWSTTLIASQNRNKITRADISVEGLSSTQERLSKLDGKAVIEGAAYGTMYAYRFAGLNDKGWPTFHINDGTKGFVSSERDIIMDAIGSTEPKLTGGWDNTFRYKNFSLGFSLAYNLGQVKRLHNYYANDQNATSIPEHYENFPRDWQNRWQYPGDENSTIYPVRMDMIKLTAATGPQAMPTENGFIYNLNASNRIHMHELYNKSDLRVVKADYIRLRAVNLFYSLPQEMMRKTPVSQLSLSLSVQNLGFWAPDKDRFYGQDPEVLGNAYATPIPVIVNFGINASF